jgi:KDO2-lipid IV(A) lauroyltransferase
MPGNPKNRVRGRRLSAHAPQSALREWVEYGGFRAALGLLRALPGPVVYPVSAAIARGALTLGSGRAAVSLANLRIAYPDLSEEERRGIARESYAHLAWNAVDAARSTTWSESELRGRFEIVDRKHLDAARAGGRGVLVLVPHLGSFELALVALALAGVPLTVVTRPFSNRRVSRDLESARSRTGAEILVHRGAKERMLEALSEGRGVVVVNDQYTRRSKGIFSPFFGVRASTSPGPAALALRSGAPVVPIYTVRDSRDRHRAVCLPAIEVERTGDRTKDIATATEHYNAVLEAIIREHPNQWMWGHRRFRHSPDLAGDPYARGRV